MNGNRIVMGGGRGESSTYPDELNNSAELRLLLVGSQSFNGWFNPRSTQSSHHFQKMAPIWCLDVEWHKLAGGQRYNIWNPTLQRRLDAGDLRCIKSERFKGKESAPMTTPHILRSLGGRGGGTYKHHIVIVDQ